MKPFRQFTATAAVGAVALLSLGAAVVQPWHRPATVPHPTIEYVMRPGTTRVGLARTTINPYYMRAVESTSYPVLFVGDSLALGWARLDQDEIAVSILGQRLGVPVGNVSASSWGPPNQLAYLDAFGTFGARVVVVLISSHDAGDVPGETGERWDAPPRPAAIDALGRMIDLAREQGATVIVAHHRELPETFETPGYLAIKDTAAAHGAGFVDLRIPEDCYVDQIHPNARGQRLFADQLESAIREALRDSHDQYAGK